MIQTGGALLAGCKAQLPALARGGGKWAHDAPHLPLAAGGVGFALPLQTVELLLVLIDGSSFLGRLRSFNSRCGHPRRR